VIEPLGSGRRGSGRRRGLRARLLVVAAGLVVAVAAGAAATALLYWPDLTLGRDSRALARVSLPGWAGHLAGVSVRDQDGRLVASDVRGGRVWPGVLVAPGTQLSIRVTVRRPGWAGWLVGRTQQRTYLVRAPVARLRSRWLHVATGAQVTVSFAAPVQAVRVRTAGEERTIPLTGTRKTVPLGIVADGSRRTGTVLVSAVARRWERASRPVPVTWFPASSRPQALVKPRPGARIMPTAPITITLSEPLAQTLGSTRPTLTPAVPGRWRSVDSHTISFTPAGLGYPIGSRVTVRLSAHVQVAALPHARSTRTLRWQVAEGSILRLQQLLAQAGYLPLDWTPTLTSGETTTRSEVTALTTPPSGRFNWRYPNTPPELKALWHPGRPNEITRAAIMMFQDTHDLKVDSFAGPHVWHALLTDTLAGKRRTDGYSYVYVHRKLPQSLNLWHNGQVILRSPGNTGVPAAPTQLGSFPVFEHIPIGTMSGTNPDGSHYHDPGIRYISYFNHGDAIHAFNRASFGTPQSLGCVELPLKAAAKVWPYTPIGTLVTVEN